MNQSVTRRRSWQHSMRVLLVLIFIMVGLYASWITFKQFYLTWKYPYGWSHCCDIALMFALLDYARVHDGKFPSGGATPEASLSLLYPKYIDAEILRGKTVPLEVVEKILQQGKSLGPTTCGWHYVDEGLTNKDDPRLGLIWDKAGLDHNGGRLRNGGHIVIFVNGRIQYISGKHWEAFEELQKKILIERKGNPLYRANLPMKEYEWLYD